MAPTGTPPAAITPQGIRDGDPAVLAALAARRGPAVLAFAESICEPSYTVRAAADAFARFRTAVASPDMDPSVHPDALLLRCARRAALDLAPRGPELGCGPATDLLAQRAERTIKPNDATLLNRHLESCDHCRDLSDRLDAADRAYREADDETLDPSAVAPMVAALAAAAPVRIPEPASTNGEADRSFARIASKTPETIEEEAPEEEPVAEAEPVADEPEAEEPPAEEALVVDGTAEEIEDEPEPEPEPAPPPEPTPLAAEEPEQTPEPEPEQTPEPDLAEREIPIGTHRVTGSPSAYYQLPPLQPRERGRRARALARRATEAASATKRARAAARKRFGRPTTPPPAPTAAESEAPAPDTATWQRVESIEFPARPADFDPEPKVEPELEESAARAAARHYRRLRHMTQERSRKPADGKPPRLLRPIRDRGPHLPLSAHGPRDLALPAGLVVVAVLVVMAVSGVFGGGSETPPTGTQASAAPDVSLVSQSATAISLADAERIAERSASVSAP